MRILIVEDEKGILNFLKQGLEEESYAVDTALEGRTGLDMALTGNYDLLLIDWMLPGKSGVEICREFRKHFLKTPVIFLTARDTVQDTIFGLQSGANDYIKKPFDLEELIIRIEVLINRNRLLEATEQPVDNVVAIGLFRYDMMRHTLLCNDKLIRLSARENEVLEVLFQYKSQLLTRKILLLRVWTNDDFFSSRSLDVYISKLRRHLSLDPAVKIINHRGFGYKLIC